MAKIPVREEPAATAHFMLSENLEIIVPATGIGYVDGYVTALNCNKPTAIFQADKIIGCWLEGV